MLGRKRPFTKSYVRKLSAYCAALRCLYCTLSHTARTVLHCNALLILGCTVCPDFALCWFTLSIYCSAACTVLFLECVQCWVSVGGFVYKRAIHFRCGIPPFVERDVNTAEMWHTECQPPYHGCKNLQTSCVFCSFLFSAGQ